MTEGLIVFVNGVRVEVPAGAVVLDAIAEVDGAAAAAIRAGAKAAVDSRGLPVAPDASLTGGFVLRVVSARARAAEAEAD